MVSFVIVELGELALPVRGRTAQEKRDSENASRILAEG